MRGTIVQSRAQWCTSVHAFAYVCTQQLPPLQTQVLQLTPPSIGKQVCSESLPRKRWRANDRATERFIQQASISWTGVVSRSEYSTHTDLDGLGLYVGMSIKIKMYTEMKWSHYNNKSLLVELDAHVFCISYSLHYTRESRCTDSAATC